MPSRNQDLFAVNKRESLEDFYNRLKMNRPETIIPSLEIINDIGHFNVFKRSIVCSFTPSPYNRRDFYKISLIIGFGILHFSNESVEVNGRALLFTNPNIPYSWEGTSEQSGYFCLFSENFIQKRNESIRDSLLWKIRSTPLIVIDKKQEIILLDLFAKMMDEMNGEYIHKYDVLRNYVNLLIHEALKVSPVEGNDFKQNNASVRLASLFIELLERQFPIGSTDHVLELKTAHDFAAKLSVHVNHLNHAVKEATGKTTSEHIAKRISNEAVALLKHTEWNISQIAYCLGFEYPANFNIFFKRQTRCTPKSLRQIMIIH